MNREIKQSRIDNNMKEAISYGADFGLKSSCLLSIFYATISTAIWIIITGNLAELLSGFYVISVGIALFLLLVVSIPLLILGAVTGATLSIVSWRVNRELTTRKAFLLGIGLGLVILLMIAVVFAPVLTLLDANEEANAIFQAKGDNGFYEGDLLMTTPGQDLGLFVLLPITIYLLASGWTSQRFFIKYNRPPNPM
jgi:hypothetical protein